MGIFRNLFSNKQSDQDNTQNNFSEGDIFYTHIDGLYQLYKLLVFDKEFNCFHVLSYTPIDTLPDRKKINELEVAIYHMPIDRNGFVDARLLTISDITSEDLIGYHEYLRQTQDPDQYVHIENNYYQTGLRFTEDKMYNAAIDSYSKAVDLLPNFYEAIDNRAFCKMDLGLWKEAIEDFQESLGINPKTLLAEFSIGECYLGLGDYQRAKVQFEKAAHIDPTHQAPKDFIKKVNELLGDS